MAITFDDLPAVRLRVSNEEIVEMTGKLLAEIERHEIPAVGFVNERKLYNDDELDDGRVEILRMWCNAGYELGNHTYSHMDLHQSTLEAFEEDVLRGEQITRPLLVEYNIMLRYFRHPLLHTGRDLETKHALENFLADRGYRIAPVTIDNSEWIYAKAYYDAREKGDDATMKRIADEYLVYMEAMIEYYEQQSRALFGREIPQILLLHANYLNADYFGQLADAIVERGYEWVALEDAIANEAYKSPDTFTGRGGITWIHRWAITAGKKGEFFGQEPTAPQWIVEAAGMEYN
jgi:peptidoglycan/xylan/chitin deacetylase (PgdA/CDA1 family)